MRRSSQVRLARELVSALLNSSLTERELIELCHDILDHGDILNDAAVNILSLVDTRSRSESRYSDRVKDEARMAYDWLRKKGVTKEKLFAALSMFSKEMNVFIHEDNPTVKEAMEFFVDRTSRSEFEHFMDAFNDDDFIKIIEDKLS
ncbi:hypothetical protein [Aeromonas veronii]|uniref:hypothetical protein n=1 Tax=Aeromonas veronii TaxID=654 RepID=UPI00143076B0|nr:hypothetical protein [Aeromonas veronii]MBL0566865.1 hypothetical protein [Aeromonas veronii]NJI10463.1 hypothetical protein [Aeromonas veronii]